MSAQLDFGSVLNYLTYGLFFVFILYGQRIQFQITLSRIGRSISRIRLAEERARKETLSYFEKASKFTGNLPERIDQILDYVTIMPVNIDPSGVVQKIEHITRTGDERLRNEVRAMMGDADVVSASVGQNMLEITSALNTIHKVVRHFFLTGKKMNSLLMLMQLQMSMPQLLEQTNALSKAVEAIKSAQPIGDGLGALVASRFLANVPKQNIAKDTVMGVTSYKGRTLYVIKAEGPAGYVGEVGTAVHRLIEEMNVNIHKMIMVDAASKLEGEKSGDIAEGIGAAIGGIGVEKFQIEDIVSKHRIPLYAVLVKESETDVLTTMSKEIAGAAERAVGVVERVIEEKTTEGENVLLAGIGNTLGIAQ